MSSETQAERGRHTISEIVSQPDCWAGAYALLAEQGMAIRGAWESAKPRQVICTGCGSAYALAQTTAALLQARTGVPARAVPASEIALDARATVAEPSQTLLIAFSRSGTTSETVAAVEAFHRIGGRHHWAISCADESSLYEDSSLALRATMARERSVAQTRSVSTMLFLAQGIAAIVGGESPVALASVPDAGRRLIETTYGLAHQWGAEEGWDRFFVLGSGALFGVAWEGAHKLREMACVHAEASHTLEFRHGLRTLVDDRALVIGLLTPTRLRQEAPVILEAAELRASTLTLLPGKPGVGHVTVHLPTHLPDWAMPVLYLPLLQLLGAARAIKQGLNPDLPRHLSMAVHLDAGTFEPSSNS